MDTLFYTHYNKVWDAITYPFPNLNGTNLDV